MNGIVNHGPVAVIADTRLSAASREVLAMQGTGPSWLDGFGTLPVFGTQPRLRYAHESNIVESQDQSVALGLLAAVDAAVAISAIDSAAAPAVADKRAESLRKGHHATVNRRPHRRSG